MALLSLNCVCAVAHLPAAKITRAWQSQDGRVIQGDLVEYNGEEIRLKRASDFQVVKVPLTALCAADKSLILDMVRERKLDVSLKDGPYAANMTGAFTKGTSKQGLNYQIFGNPKWDNTKRYPIIIWMHGSGQSGSDNEAQMGGATGAFTAPNRQEKNPCFLLAPQCPDSDIGWNKDVAGNLMALLADLAANLPLDQQRIYLTGSSMGGFGTFSLVQKYPEVFAAGVPLCGGSDVKNAPALMKTPLWAFHGDKDDMVPVAKTRDVMNAISAAGAKNSKYSELAGQGHGISGLVYAKDELHEWIFAQRRCGD